MRALLSLALVLLTLVANAQLPGPVIGTAVAIPAGSFNCAQQSFGSPIGVSGEPSQVTFCFNYFNVGPVNLSFILVSGLCGPFPLYNTLSFTIYDTNAILVTSGTIVPIANNTNITTLLPNTWYTFCYTWTPNCAQFSGCPLIYTSVLPIDLLYFQGLVSDNVVTLLWATATETNVDRYEILKSQDLQSYTTVGSIQSDGNSVETRSYKLIDNNKINTTTYYMLREVTIDNKFIDHKIIAVNPSSVDAETMQIYDIFGREVYSLISGVNVIRKGNMRYKVIQVDFK